MGEGVEFYEDKMVNLVIHFTTVILFTFPTSLSTSPSTQTHTHTCMHIQIVKMNSYSKITFHWFLNEVLHFLFEFPVDITVC
jgi:hypothetical protein